MTAATTALAGTLAASIREPFGEGWPQVAEFAVAFVLSGAIGLEREIRQKAAGLRTYTVVGLGAALFTLVSKYGFTDVLVSGRVVLDPSRMAAQIVSGLGFIGGGVIFVQRGSVRGLTTAATIWLTAAIGCAAGAGLPVLAAVTTGAYFVLSYAVRPLVHRLPPLRVASFAYRITYTEGSGLLRELVNLCTDAGFSIADLTTITPPERRERRRRRDAAERAEDSEPAAAGEGGGPAATAGRGDRTVEVTIGVQGRGDPQALLARLAQVPGVLACSRTDSSDE
jgi:putative Mg2+ transporter-C (MgtC) family protein